MIARSIAVIVAAILVAVLAIRNAAVMALAESRPEAAARFWSGHPAVEISAGMTAIANATRAHRPIPASAFDAMASASAKDPLAPEPFLVRGVQAQISGDGATAQRAFEAAQWRDPRSLPAAYFLADRYFRIGDVARGLNEMAALARLTPAGRQTVAPYLATYARNPSNWPALNSLFRADPELADPTLVLLATNIDTAPAVLALADPHRKEGLGNWIAPLLNTLTAAGRYAEAKAIWAKSFGVPGSGELLHDTAFADRTSPPPFNWALTSSTVGLAERQPGGRLHLIYYGQEDGFLASQLVLLPPGTYRLSMELLGDPGRARALSWSVWCDKAAAPLASATLDAAATRGLTFQVPSGCAAQWVRLAGASSDISQQTDVTISGVKLERVAPRA